MGEDLKFFDQALLNNKHHDKDFYRYFVKFLNKIPEEGKTLDDEIEKTPREVNIIMQAKNRVKEDMRFFNRNKEIDLPLNMVYIVPKGKKAKYSSMFLRGIAVEQSDSDYQFAARVYQELFRRMCFSIVGAGRNKKLFYIDDGAVVLRKGIASFMARKFIEECGFVKDIEEDVFNPDAESILNFFLQEIARGRSVEKETVQKIFYSAVINGTAFLKALEENISSAESELVVAPNR